MKKLMLAAALAATALPSYAQTPRPNVNPAMWVVRDADTTVYLFGTVHALDGKQDWFNDEVKRAYDASQEVVVEAILPEPAKAQPKIMELAVDKNGKLLATKLKAETAAMLGTELAKLGAPATALEKFEPWYASMVITALTLQKVGVKPEHGVEEVLKAAAKKDGKPVGEVEGFDWQMNLFDTLPEELQVQMLSSGLKHMGEATKIMADMTHNWASGDIEALAKIINDGLNESPGLSKILLADRNARWAEWIDTRLDTPGTVFMAVGAGHLGGKESVQDYLRKRGIKSARVKQ